MLEATTPNPDMPDSIFLPRTLATLVEVEEPPAETAYNLRRPFSPSDDTIHVQKKRSSKSSIATDRSKSSGTGSQADSFVSAVEYGPHSSVDSTQVAERFSTRLNWRDNVTLAQLEEGRLSSMTRGSRTPSHELINRPRDNRHTSLASYYNMANLVKIKHRRKFWVRVLLEYAAYIIFAAFVYLVLVGLPLWDGAVYWLYWLVEHKFVFRGGWSIAIILVIFYSYIPLLVPFEDDPPGPEFYSLRRIQPAMNPTCALIIPAYRSDAVIGRTLDAALKIFPASHIYVVANGNSSSPLDNTEQICHSRAVNHIWCPMGSKIIAIFVGCHAVKQFRHVLLMDDDCILPPNFPVATSRLNDRTRCIAYTIKCVGGYYSKMSWCQKAQDLEYKLAGLQRSFAGRVGSATFPHGAISLWDKSFLKKTLERHPGFSLSEDWFMGHSCRQLGGRIKMCSAVFVETDTPAALLFTGRSRTRGGFGETTLFQQRFLRWNFFVVSGLWHNLTYIVTSWKLGWWEFGTKLFVFQEVYETLTYLLTPFLLPISLLVRPVFCSIILAVIMGLYLLQAIIFNECHLRRKNERSGWIVIIGYYLPYKICLNLINIVGCYWSLFRYARYFAQQRLKLTEDHKVVGMVLKLEEQLQGASLGRRLTVKRVSVVTGGGSQTP